MSQTKICICGGGSLGIVCAGVFASQGMDVRVWTGHPENWAESVMVEDPDGKIYAGPLTKVSSKPSDCVSDADIVLLCVPGYLLESTLVHLKPFLAESTVVVSIVSSTGFFQFAHKILGDSNTLVGFQRVPFIARYREYGKTGSLLGYKKRLNVAIEFCDDVSVLLNELKVMFLSEIHLLESFYEAALTNSNPILHTSRLYSMWKDYNGELLDKNTLFYRDWTVEASEILMMMDDEFQKLLETLSVTPGAVPRLLEYYESTDALSLTEKLKSIEAFKSIKSPMIHVTGGWKPDFGSRYFTEDFPFGLRFIKELCDKHSINAPMITRVYEWGCSKLDIDERK